MHQPRLHQGWRRLPAWIIESDAYEGLTSGYRFLLRAVADRAVVDDQGSLVHVVGGVELMEAVGCSRRTFFRRVARLVELGFLVVMARGGQVGGKNVANVYGIPAQPGALRQVVKCNRPADRRPDSGTGGRVKLTPGVGSEWPGGSVKMTHHHGSNGYGCKTHGAGVVSSRPTWSALTPDDLWDTRRLLELYAIAVRRGWIEQSEAARIRFVAWAESACNWCNAGNPCGVFVSNVKHKRDLFIRQQDEDRAVARLKRHDAEQE